MISTEAGRRRPSDLEERAKAMDAVKAKLSVILDYVPVQRPVIYLDYPLHLNIGDLLIWLGAEAFFHTHGHRIVGRGICTKIRGDLRRRVTPETTIVLHGGGNFGDLYPVHQRFRERVVEAFPDNKIVLLPQTIHFGDEAAAAASARIFNGHRDVTMFVRDLPSLAFAERFLDMPILLAPDTAHQLWGSLGNPNEMGTGALGLIRKDIEATAAGADLLRPGEPQVDWIDLSSVWRRKLHAALRRLHVLQDMVDHELGGASLWRAYCRQLCDRMAAIFSAHETIVTNRLHACILGALLCREVRYFDNSYGKVGAYADVWMAGMPGIRPISAVSAFA
ncbi:MAG TPA: polysaccharide pyruvyl transferase family protein [Aliidongia sp.]|nr:polysaccharide pyruvyl transferase family protein [Aliidongia sp.]